MFFSSSNGKMDKKNRKNMNHKGHGEGCIDYGSTTKKTSPIDAIK